MRERERERESYKKIKETSFFFFFVTCCCYLGYNGPLSLHTSVFFLQEAGDVSERQELRRHLQCHSFGWYLKNVLPERYLPDDPVAHGPVRTFGERRKFPYCLLVSC